LDGRLIFGRIDQSKLTTLDVGSNFIPEIENLSHLSHLTELWVRMALVKDSELLDNRSFNGQVNHNKIKTLQALEPQLSSLPLQTIYLEGNPCQQTEGVNYRRKIMLALPTLNQIDAT
jgi:protein phosphatase 1 regulatory subunit 7